MVHLLLVNSRYSKKGITFHNNIETLEGQIDHCAFIIPLAQHFLHTIRSLPTRSKQAKTSKISNKERKYFKTWLKFLQSVNKGVSMNNIVYRCSIYVLWDDSWLIVIGGVSHLGSVYICEIIRHLQGRVSNNTLDFLDSLEGCWVYILEGHVPQISCYLAMTYSSFAVGGYIHPNLQPRTTTFTVTLQKYWQQNL